MKKILVTGIATCLLCAGCTNQDVATTNQVVAETGTELETIASDSGPIIEIKGEDLEPFFKDLFSYTEEELMSMNQNPTVEYEGYFSILDNYKKLIKGKLEKHLSKDLNEQLASTQIKLDFDLPSKVFTNEYVVDAGGKVEQVEVVSLREVNDRRIYKVNVTKSHFVTPIEQFSKDYAWNEQLGYYVKGAVDQGAIYSLPKEEPIPTYMYANTKALKDSVKIVSQYWVEVSLQEDGSFKIEGLNQASQYELHGKGKNTIQNNQYIQRIPFYTEASAKERQTLLKVMTNLMTRPVESFNYFETVHKDSFSLFTKMWDDFGIGQYIIADDESYKVAFPKTINPYKDNIKKISINDKYIQTIPSIYSTELQPAFIVSIPAQVTLQNDKEDYLNYKYYVSMENEKIESIQFIKMDKITQEEYEAGSLEEDNVEELEKSLSNEETTSEDSAQVEDSTQVEDK